MNSQTEKEEDVLDAYKYHEKIGEYLYDEENDCPNEKVLRTFFTQTFVPEKEDLSEYDIIGILTLPAS